MNFSPENIKLSAGLDNILRVKTVDNATKFLQLIKSQENVNLQSVQPILLARILFLIDWSKSGGGKINVNEFRMALIQCISSIVERSKIMQELQYKTILGIVIHELVDAESNRYKADQSEELKIAVLECFEVASRNLDSNAVERFFVKENQPLLGKFLFTFKEVIVQEKYWKIRKKAVEAFMAFIQCHDHADLSDLVLREQISKLIFVVLPKISTTLIKVCMEDTLRGPHLIQATVKALGRFLVLIFYDYEKKQQQRITNESFLQLTTESHRSTGEKIDLRKSTTASRDKILDLQKTDEWLASSSKNLSMVISNLGQLRYSKHREIRYELAVMSYSLLANCLPNIEHFKKFLLENLIFLCVDEDSEIQSYSEEKLKEIAEAIPSIDCMMLELFNQHLNAMPRILLTGLEVEKVAGLSGMASYIKVFASIRNQLDIFLSNVATLEKFLNILICCCELELPENLVSFETSNASSLSDEFYNLKIPWKKFKHVNTDASKKLLAEVFRGLAQSKSAFVCVNFILDNMNSIEHSVCLIELLSCEEKLSIESQLIENILEEFLSDTYWSMPVRLTEVSEVKKKRNEEYYKDSTPGLYESAIEVRLYETDADDEDAEERQKFLIKTINYNVLCTCIVLELTGRIALNLGKKFQRFLLRCLHKVLEKAGSSNFLIKSAGLYALNCIKDAMNYADLSELIDENSSFLLFNTHKLLKHSKENESVLDMLSIIFKYSKTSVVDFVDDIVEMAANQMSSMRKSENSRYYLKLFELYVGSLGNEVTLDDLKLDDVGWDDFLENCLNELCAPDEETEMEENVPADQDEPTCEKPEEAYNPTEEKEEEKEKLPLHIELILKILKASLPFFASPDQTEVILANEIFRMAFGILHIHENEFNPMVHEMWYPFTKQFEAETFNFVTLQYAFQLLVVITSYAKDFVYNKSITDIIPKINKFLASTFEQTNSKTNFSFTQVFKLQREVLSEYGKLAVDLGIEDKNLDDIIEILILYNRKHFSEHLRDASRKSLDFISKFDPMLMSFKNEFH